MQWDLTVLWRSGRKDWSVGLTYLIHWTEAVNDGMLVCGVGGVPCLAVIKVMHVESPDV